MDKFSELEKTHFMQPTKAAVIQYVSLFLLKKGTVSLFNLLKRSIPCVGVLH